MYERFTDRANKVLGIAEYAAKLWQHDHIGTEHLLWGLLDEGTGIASHVLKELGVTSSRLREEISKSCAPSSLPPTAGKMSYTVAAKQVIEHALEEAAELKHDFVGTEHLLLGLYREAVANRGLAAGLLQDLGVDVQQLRSATLALLSPEPSPALREERWQKAQRYAEQYLAPLMAELQEQLMERFPGLCVCDYALHLAEEVGKWTVPVLAGPVNRDEDSHA